MNQQAILTLNNVSKRFVSKQGQHQALNQINLSIFPGEIFGVIGQSGAGKSTFLRCLNLLERPTSGEIWFDHQEITKLKQAQLRPIRQQMSMIFQHFNLLSSRTVWQNIAFPLELIGQSKQEITHTITPLLDLIGLSDRKDHYPSQLSGGQKQRVAIARALASKPKVLLCDEATSALDPKTTQSILNLLKEINQKLNLTIVLITHQMDVIKQVSHRVAVLDKGELVQLGTASEIFEVTNV